MTVSAIIYAVHQIALGIVAIAVIELADDVAVCRAINITIIAFRQAKCLLSLAVGELPLLVEVRPHILPQLFRIASKRLHVLFVLYQ